MHFANIKKMVYPMTNLVIYQYLSWFIDQTVDLWITRLSLRRSGGSLPRAAFAQHEPGQGATVPGGFSQGIPRGVRGKMEGKAMEIVAFHSISGWFSHETHERLHWCGMSRRYLPNLVMTFTGRSPWLSHGPFIEIDGKHRS